MAEKFNPYKFIGDVGKGNNKLAASTGINPYQLGSTVYNALQDNTIYKGSTSIGDMDNIGTTGAGTMLQGLGDMAIASGNPYAMAGGAALKSLTGLGETLGYALGNREMELEGGNFSTQGEPVFDLGSDARSIDGLNPSRLIGEGAKKAGLLAPLGVLAGFAAKKRAKRYKEDAKDMYSGEANRFNTLASNRDQMDMAQRLQFQRRAQAARQQFNVM